MARTSQRTIRRLAVVAFTAAALVVAQHFLRPASHHGEMAQYGSDVDKKTTGSVVPVAGSIRPDEPATTGSARLKLGLDALARGDSGMARVVRDGFDSGALDRHILTWAIALDGGPGVASDEIAAALHALAGWPGENVLRRNEERALYREQPSPRAVIAALGGSEPRTAPRTAEGVIVLARSYVALGQADKAVAVLSPFWRTEKLGASDEAAIINEFGVLIPARDHRARMERMLYSDRVNSAGRVAGLADATELWKAWGAVIRRQSNAGKLLDAVPENQRSAGYTMARIQFLRRAGRIPDAAALMAKAPRDAASLIDPDAWWVERRVLSRELLDRGDAKTAYEIAAGHSAESPPAAADAEFHAGWYALRFLDDPAAAARHFSRIAEIAEGPISLSRAFYWQGRAAEVGGPGNAASLFEKAAAYDTTFYGQLAAARLGRQSIALASPQPAAAERQRFGAREAVRAIARLEATGFAARAEILYRDLAGQLSSPGEVALLSEMAEARGDHFLALRIAKIAAARGVDVGGLSHPIGAIPNDADISTSGEALAYAVARQESEFNIGAVSGAGALGLLQLLPTTAKGVAQRNGMPFSAMRLTSDAAYNATLGAAFLGEQLDRFDGSYVLTFAGYNAGPRRAREWADRYGDPRGKDIDAIVDWIERIPFTETRSYVQRVMENYEVYKARLGGRFDIVRDLVNGR
jgi:soluble lytic murein transglycosylase